MQWEVSTDGGTTFSPISGATSTTYSFTNSAEDNGKQYEAIFTNSVGTVTTIAASLTVNYAPSVTTNPTTQTINTGGTASFAAAAAGNPAPGVQWEVSTDGGTTFSPISGATSTTCSFTTSVSDNGKQYEAVFTNALGSMTTTVASLTVDYAPGVTTNPTSQALTAGRTASFTAAASGNPTPGVQWAVSTDGGTTFSLISGATSTTYSFTTSVSDNGKQFEAIFTNLLGTATTTATTLSVAPSANLSVANLTAAADLNGTVSVTWRDATRSGRSATGSFLDAITSWTRPRVTRSAPPSCRTSPLAEASPPDR